MMVASLNQTTTATEVVTVDALKRYYVDNDGTNGDSETMLVAVCSKCANVRHGHGEYIQHAETPARWEQDDMACEDCGGTVE